MASHVRVWNGDFFDETDDQAGIKKQPPPSAGDFKEKKREATRLDGQVHITSKRTTPVAQVKSESANATTPAASDTAPKPARRLLALRITKSSSRPTPVQTAVANGDI